MQLILLYSVFYFLFSCSVPHDNLYDWNVMIYIAADNDEQNSISEFADYSIKRITLGASEKSSNINVSVFCDGRYKRYTGGKSGANHFKLGENGMVNSKYLGETNSGSLDTFKRFFDDNFNMI